MFLSRLSFKALSAGMIGVLVLMALVLGGSAVTIQGRIGDTDAFWQTYQHATAPRAVAVERIIAALGYGGMIHHYKAYILTKDENLLPDVLASAGEALGAVEDYRSVGHTAEEDHALDALDRVIRDYRARTVEITALIGAGLDARTIHEGLFVEDDPALEALDLLRNAVAASQGDTSQKTRTQSLANLRTALGFGAMIHRFYDLVLGEDDGQRDGILAATTQAREALAAYRTLDLDDDERAALATIDKTLDTYEAATGRALSLFGQDLTAEDIGARLALDDEPALAAFVTLERALAARLEGGRARMDSNLATTTWLAASIMAVTVVSSVVMVVLVVWIQVFRMVRPIGAITRTMGRMSEGDLKVTVPGLDRGDEIGQMARAMEVFREGLIKAESMAESERREQAAKAAHARELEALLRDFDLAMVSILESLDQADMAMKSTAGRMTEGAQDTRREAASVNEAAVQVSANVDAVASAAEELSSSIGEIGRQVAQASGVAREAVGHTGATGDKLNALEEAVGRISEVVSLINDIASQTNLLALNATIEAARAGEMGKGFAVVAGEVKALANQTARATEDIRRQIQDVQSATRESVQSMTAVGDVIRAVDDISAGIAAAVEEQGAATREIARNVEQAARDTKGVTDAIENVRIAAENTDQGAKEITQASRNLSAQTATLRQKVTEFLRQVRGDGDTQRDLIEWDDSLAFGIPAIDNDHKELLALTNALYRLMKQGEEGSLLDKAFRDLEAYIKRHFTNEEGIMERSRYPDIDAHRRAHQGFVVRMQSLYGAYRKGNTNAGVDLMGFLGSWWLDHIRKVDRAVADHLHRTGAATTPRR